METPVLKLVRPGHSKGQNFGGNGLKFTLAFLSHAGTLKVTETWACFWITFPSQMEIVPTQNRINVYFLFFFPNYISERSRKVFCALWPVWLVSHGHIKTVLGLLLRGVSKQ